MGGQIEQWLRQSPEQQPSSIQEKPNSVASWLADDDTAKLRLSAELSDPLKAKQAARVLRLHSQTGIPIDVIERDADEVERRATSRIEPDDLRRISPSVAGWLAEHPLNVSAAGKEVPKLSAIERMTRALKTGARVGWAQSQEGMLGFEASQRGGQLEPWQRERLTELSTRIQEIEETSPVGPFLNILYQGAKIYGQMADAIPRAFVEGLAGASAGAAAAAVGGPTIVLAPWAAAGGFAVGLTHGFTEYAFRVEGGQAYLELSRIQDEEGNKLSEDTKRNAALGVGAVNALLETTGAGFIVAPFRSATRKLMRNAVSDALYRPTMAGALADFGKAYATAIAGETSTEVLQELTNVIAEELAMNADKMDTPEDREAVIKRLSSIAQQTVAGMLLVGFPGAITTGSATAVNARRAQRREQLFLALGETIAESETFANLPEAVQQVVERTVAKGPVENVYIPVQQWNEYWQGKEVDPADMAQRILGNRDEWEQAEQSGGDIRIPTSRYATEIAPTEHNKFFAKEMRTGPNELSAREAEELLDEQKKEAEQQADEKEEARSESAKQVGADVTKQLTEAGYDEETARTESVLYERFFRSLSERTGVDPQELYNRYNLKIRRMDEHAEAQAKEEGRVLTQLSDDQIVELFMAWKGVLQDPDIAQHLKDLAWVKVLQLEGPARAIRARQTAQANERTRIKFGHDDFPHYKQGPRNPKVPGHAVKSLEDLLNAKREELQAESATNLKQWRAFKYLEHIYNLAKHGTFDDVNVFVAQLEDSDVAAGAEALAMLEQAEDFTRWRDDMNMEPPDLFTLEQRGRQRAWRVVNTDISPDKASRVTLSRDTRPDAEPGRPWRLTFWKRVRKNWEPLVHFNYRTEQDAVYALENPEAGDFDDPRLPQMWREDWEGFEELDTQEFFQEARPLPPGFFSKAESLIEAKMPNRAPVQDVRNILKDIKVEERKWLGLDEWLGRLELDAKTGGISMLGGGWYVSPEGIISKTAVLEFLRAHRLKIAEIESSHRINYDNITEEQQELWEDNMNEQARTDAQNIIDEITLEGEDQNTFTVTEDGRFTYNIPLAVVLDGFNSHFDNDFTASATPEDVENFSFTPDFWSEEGAVSEDEPITFSSRALARRHLIRSVASYMLGNNERYASYVQDLVEADMASDEEIESHVAYERWTLPGGENYRIVAFQLPDIDPQFTDTHTGVSTKPNIFAHARLKDRTGPNGEKILFVEEIQSDWHQKGRDQGYAGDSVDNYELKLSEATTDGFRIWNSRVPGDDWRTLGMTDRTHPTEADVRREIAANPNFEVTGDLGKVPDAPFRNTWYEFVFKRLIRMAAEGGYDQIAWTTGDQQGDRYNLFHHVDELRLWLPDGVDPELHPEAEVTLKGYKDGRVVAQPLVKLNQLGDYIGKEVAVALMSQKPSQGRVANDILHEIADVVEREAGAEFSDRFVMRVQDAAARPQYRTDGIEEFLHEIIQYYQDTQYGYEIDRALEELRPLLEELFNAYASPPGARILKKEEGIQLVTRQAQGMRGFYDDILVRFANNFGKKYKAQHEIGTIPEIADKSGILQERGGWVPWHYGVGQNPPVLPSREAAERYIDEASTIHVVRLTPEIKQAALRNEFALYQFGKAAKGKLWMDAYEEVRNRISAIADDVNTVYGKSFERAAIERPELMDDYKLMQQFLIHIQERDLGAAYAYLSSLPPNSMGALSKITPKLFKWIMEAQPLNQNARGRIQIGETGINIDMLKGADLSTFIHETGHFYLEVMHDLKDKSDDLRQDYDTVRKWLGAEGDSPFTREQHEMFARGFEKYLAEGRSPVPALRRVFIRFKVWLLSVYSSLDELNVELTDEVRQVFGKLLSSEAELKAINARAEPLFSDSSVLDEDTARDYQDKVEAARDSAAEEIQKSIIREWRRESTRVFQAEREKTKREVGQQANENPWFRARALLAHGTLPSGDSLPEGEQAFKLSYENLLVEHGKNKVERLPKGVHARDGLHPDMAADLLGFKSGHELVNALLASEDPQEWIERQTTRIMRGKKTGMQLMPEAQVPTEALKAVHNEKRARLLHRELELLAEQEFATFKKMAKDVASPAKSGETKEVKDKRGRVRRIPTIEVIRAEAERAIAAKRVRDLQSSLYLRAERKAATEAMELFLKGDIAGAFQSKQKELLNHELYRAAVAAEEEVEKIAAYARKFDEDKMRRRIGLAGGTYLEQIDGIRERFEFSELSGRAVDKKIALRQWIAEQNNMMLEPVVSEKVQNEAFRQNYQELTVEELREVHDAMKSIAALARVKNRLLASARKRNFNEVRSDIVEEVKNNHKLKEEPLDLNPSFGKNLRDGVRGFMAAHNKAEFIFEWLDGFKEMGTVWTYFFKPFVDAENAENRMQREAAEISRRIFGRYTAMERSSWSQKRTFQMGKKSATLTKANILTMALNWGNVYNREALLAGYEKYGWDESGVLGALDTLDERDWQTVQEIWDWLDSYWPQVERLQREVNGLPPQKVEATPVHTKYGTFRGGYYPVIFDNRLSWKQAALDLKQQIKELFGGYYARAMTRHGHTEERVGSGGKAIKLSLSGLSEHVNNVIHDLSHRRAVIDVSRLIDDAEIRMVMEQSIGTDMYRQLRPWLMHIAAPKYIDFSNPIEQIASRARTGATIVNLGWKMTTAMVQWLGFTNSINEIGPTYAARGMAKVYGRPDQLKKNWEFVTSRSEFMRHRLSNYDRDVGDALKRMNVGESRIKAVATPIRNSFFMAIGWMDMAVSLPSWLGAYSKVMDGKVEGIAKGDEKAAIDYADKVIRQTQGVGNAKDLATIQRGPETVKLFTMFYTYFSGLYNQFAKATRRVRRDKDVGRFAAAALLLWFIPAVMGEYLLGRAPDSEDDEEAFWKWLIGATLSYPAQSVVIVRDIVNGMRYRGYEPSAAFDMFSAFADAGKMVTEQISDVFDEDDKEVTRYQIEQSVQAVGYAAQLPTRQLWLTMEYLFDWWTGEEEPETPAEGLFRSLVAGKPRE